MVLTCCLVTPEEMTTGENTATAVQQFLDTNFRQNIGLKPKIRPKYQLYLILGYPNQLQIILEQEVPVLSFAMGDPSKFVKQIHSLGAKVMSMITTVEEALHMVAKNETDIMYHRARKQVGIDLPSM